MQIYSVVLQPGRDWTASGIEFTSATNGFRLIHSHHGGEPRLLKILSRPHIVTQNNISALIKQRFTYSLVTQAQLRPPTVLTLKLFCA